VQVPDGTGGTRPLWSAGDDVIVQGDGFDPHRLFLGFAIACGNLAVRPIFMAPVVDGQAWNDHPIRTYEDDLDYMCLKFVDEDDPKLASKWFCGGGNLADGVTGLASIKSSPRSFLINKVALGQNTWSHHWEFPAGLGAISGRIAPADQTGFAQDDAWNLNPNDFHADGSSKVLDYIAALGVKTATNRNGVNISPYNTHNLEDYWVAQPGAVVDSLQLALLNPSEMNQGEVEIRSCGTPDSSQCFDYLLYPDVLSDGTVGNGPPGLMNQDLLSGYAGAVAPTSGSDFAGVINISVGPWYESASSFCSWKTDWNLPTAPTNTFSSVIDWSASADGTVVKPDTLFTAPYKVAINLGSHETQRCPTWNLCDTNTQSPNSAWLLALDVNGAVIPRAVGFSYDSHIACPDVNAISQCQGFLCGTPIAVQSNDGTAGDWWLCSGGSCGLSPDNWELVCPNQTACVTTMADDDTVVVRVPVPNPTGPNATNDPNFLSVAFNSNARTSSAGLQAPSVPSPPPNAALP
jgi:hypothetical protein